MSIEENKMLVRDCVEEVFNKGNVTAKDEYFAPNFAPPLQPGVTHDREDYKQFVAMFRELFIVSYYGNSLTGLKLTTLSRLVWMPPVKPCAYWAVAIMRLPLH